MSSVSSVEKYDEVQLSHGGGGKLTHQLLEGLIFPNFDNEHLRQRHDGAVFETENKRLAFTTDSFVVTPLFFPGGDIGKLAVWGTVNDLAMCGARPRLLSAGLIIEEGFSLEKFKKIIESMQHAAEVAGTKIVTGDTKVVERGKADGIYINTAGVGEVLLKENSGPAAIKAGDKIVLSGDVGSHGMAVLSRREGLEFESEIKSDCAPLWPAVEALIKAGIEPRCMRDLTRGGLATNLNELLNKKIGISIDREAVPVKKEVAAVCEILGLDPFYSACEGRMVVVVPPDEEDKTIKVLSQLEVTQDATTIGEVTADNKNLVSARSAFGVDRVLEVKSGEQLPRIC